MDMQQGDLDRIFFFEHARKTAEATYAKDPLDADVRFFFFFLNSLFGSWETVGNRWNGLFLFFDWLFG